MTAPARIAFARRRDLPPKARSSHLVVVGSSAGGIDALSRLVSGLPADFDAPVVVAQHLDPTRASHLREILDRRTALRVVTVETAENLEPGVLYVVPANRNVEISDHSVTVVAGDGSGPRPSVDRLLETASRAFGEQLIAVILSGAGSDGAAGARAVKFAGGAVVIQDPDTADFPSMPASVAPTTVDVVAKAEAIGRLLVDLISGELRVAKADENDALELVLAQLRDQSGIDFGRYKRPTIVRRLARRIAAVGASSTADYLAYLDDHPEELQRLTSSFLIKVTEFFRDEGLFARLREQVVPELVAEARDAGRRELRIWSAGCATGEEPYSIAMIVADVLGEDVSQWTVRIFATDIDDDAIMFARRGIYPTTSIEALPSALGHRYFHPLDGAFIVNKTIRGMVVFGQHDLATRAPFPRVDLVLCRNVLIYFTPELQRRALQVFAYSLRDAGVLVLGKAESTSRLATAFVLEDAALKIYRRQGERVIAPPHTEPLAQPPVRPRRRAAAPPQERGRDEERAADVLQRLPLGIVEVDSNYDIRTINSAARAFLGIRGTAVGKDLVHLARSVPANELRTGIDQAFAGLTWSGVFLLPSPDAGDSARVPVHIEVRPVRQIGGSPPGAIVLIDDATELTDRAAREEDERVASMTPIESVAEHAQRLATTNRGLVADNEELALSNVGLRAENEQLLVAAEQAQATAEEVETLNEELQATNEELETLNEELQATNEELNTTNDDMEARHRELELLTTSLVNQHAMTEQARLRLDAVLAGLPDAIAVADTSGSPTLTNATYRHLLTAIRFLEEGVATPAAEVMSGLLDRAAAGERFATECRGVDEAGNRHWYEITGQPVGSEGVTRGGVLIAHDVTERGLRLRQAEFVAIVAHELRTPLTALRGYLQLLGQHLGDAPSIGDSAARYAGLALEQAGRLQDLVADLFETARVDAGQMSFSFAELELGAVVLEAVDVGRTVSERHRIVADPVELGVRVLADHGRLQQVILNVITNAVTHAGDSPVIELSVRREGNWGVMEIVDHGPGIPEAELATLFSRYRNVVSSGSGLGLGLYISRQIVARHGGTIEALATPGGGLTIRIRLPMAPSDGYAATVQPADASADPANRSTTA